MPGRRKLSPSAEVIELIHVFVSSSQDEFGQLRSSLKDDIESAKLSRSFMFKVELVEERKGAKIEKDIRDALEKSSVYVGIVGYKYSEWVTKEYEIASEFGMPLLVYEYRRRSKRKLKKRSDRMWKFVETKVIGRDVRVRGHGRKYTKEMELISSVIADLAFYVGKMVNESRKIRGLVK